MEWLSTLINNLVSLGFLPQAFENQFMARAFIAAVLLGPLLAALGTLIISRKQVFFTQTIGNASLTGVALGLMLGEPMGQTYAGLYGVAIITALTMTYFSHRSGAATDTMNGIMLALVLGIGIVLLVVVTQQFNVHQVEAILFGSLITLSINDLIIVVLTASIALFILATFFNRFILATLSPMIAQARGDSPKALDYFFIITVTVVIVSSLKIVGALLVLVLIVIPVATAQNLATNIVTFFWASTILGFLGATGGLIVSASSPIPTGGAIALVAGSFYLISLIIKMTHAKTRVTNNV